MSRLHLWAMIGWWPSVMVKDLECGSIGLLPTLLTLYSLRCLTTEDGSLISEFEVQHFSNLTEVITAFSHREKQYKGETKSRDN
ncbi:hypothetical protein ACFX15_039403 [Malus domestica]